MYAVRCVNILATQLETVLSKSNICNKHVSVRSVSMGFSAPVHIQYENKYEFWYMNDKTHRSLQNWFVTFPEWNSQVVQNGAFSSAVVNYSSL